ncbi:hypothetical protein [Trinickia dinghuensis]|uniref:Uncharacterized protein n=1 Tax=Trinickia dinghuensis TaxID=2291023 RepID=A0A3D8JRB5_9BURK|nr:hypothetical protein [Trinickia dinghuensis]RDU95265.1 hypothetical protein DWV00_30240 [Trinickia dinghuensis]
MDYENERKRMIERQKEAAKAAARDLNVRTLWLVMGSTCVFCAILDGRFLEGMFYLFAIVNFAIFFALKRLFASVLAVAPKVGKILVALWAFSCLTAILTFSPEPDWLDWKHTTSDGMPTPDMSHSVTSDKWMIFILLLWGAIAVWTVLSLIRRRVGTSTRRSA